MPSGFPWRRHRSKERKNPSLKTCSVPMLAAMIAQSPPPTLSASGDWPRVPRSRLREHARVGVRPQQARHAHSARARGTQNLRVCSGRPWDSLRACAWHPRSIAARSDGSPLTPRVRACVRSCGTRPDQSSPRDQSHGRSLRACACTRAVQTHLTARQECDGENRD